MNRYHFLNTRCKMCRELILRICKLVLWIVNATLCYMNYRETRMINIVILFINLEISCNRQSINALCCHREIDGLHVCNLRSYKKVRYRCKDPIMRIAE